MEDYRSFIPCKTLTKIPFVRGVFNFIDSMVIGMKTLTYSASFYEDEEDAGKPKDEKSEALMMGGTVALSIVLAIGIFMLLPYFAASLFRRLTDSALVISVLEGVLRLVIFLGYIALISRMEDIQRVFQYHGAEHKCINCIEHGMELNVENVQKSSRLHRRMRDELPAHRHGGEHHFLSVYPGKFPAAAGGGADLAGAGDRWGIL